MLHFTFISNHDLNFAGKDCIHFDSAMFQCPWKDGKHYILFNVTSHSL